MPLLSPEERREKRKKEMVFQKFKSLEEAEQADEEYWLNMPIEDKFQATIELIRDSWYVQGNSGPPPRLDRSTFGVRKG